MSEVKVVSIESDRSPAVVSKIRVGYMAHLIPRGNLVVQESLDALRLAIEHFFHLWAEGC